MWTQQAKLFGLALVSVFEILGQIEGEGELDRNNGKQDRDESYRPEKREGL